ncbi:HAMP domain-containing protein [bacterium]|nr:HAMP domain-containing protein [bacterium]
MEERIKVQLRHSIKLRIMLAAVVLLVFLTFIMIILINVGLQNAENEIDGVGEALIKNSIYSLQTGIITEDEGFLRQPMEALIKEQNILWVGAYNSSGDLISSLGKPGFVKIHKAEATLAKKLTADLKKDIIHSQKEKRSKYFYTGVYTQGNGASEKIGYVKLIMDRSKANKAAAKNINVVLIIVFLILSLFGFVYYFAISKVLRGLKTIRNAIMELSEGSGDLTFRLHYPDSDELGELVGYLNRFLGVLENLVGRITQISGHILDYSENLSSAAEEMSASTQEISSTIEELSDGMMHQSEKVENVKNFVKQVSEFAVSIKESSQQTLGSFDGLVSLAGNSKNEVGDSLTNLDEVRDLFTEIEQLIGELTNLSTQVGEFVSSIKNIANQTNLLALNAAIEAARAGEAGKGFTVVAEQVKKLSEQSSSESEKVEITISQVQKQVTALANTIANGAEVIKGLSHMSASTENAFNEIVNGIQQANSNLERINAQIVEQVDGTQKINDSILEIAAISEEGAASTEQASSSTEEQAASMQELSAAAIELANISKNLKKQVDQFNIKKDEDQDTEE